jgi:hypothetical protein
MRERGRSTGEEGTTMRGVQKVGIWQCKATASEPHLLLIDCTALRLDEWCERPPRRVEDLILGVLEYSGNCSEIGKIDQAEKGRVDVELVEVVSIRGTRVHLILVKRKAKTGFITAGIQ